MPFKEIKSIEDIRPLDFVLIDSLLMFKNHFKSKNYKYWLAKIYGIKSKKRVIKMSWKNIKSRLINNNTVEFGWFTNEQIIEKVNSKEYKAFEKTNSLPKYLNPLRGFGLMEKGHLTYKQKWGKSGGKPVYRLHPKGFKKLFMIYYKKGKHTQLLTSDYYDIANKEGKIKEIISDFIKYLSLDINDVYLKSFNRRKIDRKFLLLYYADLFNEYLKDKKKFKKTLRSVGEEIMGCVKGKVMRALDYYNITYTHILMSSMLIHQIIINKIKEDKVNIIPLKIGLESLFEEIANKIYNPKKDKFLKMFKKVIRSKYKKHREVRVRT